MNRLSIFITLLVLIPNLCLADANNKGVGTEYKIKAQVAEIIKLDCINCSVIEDAIAKYNKPIKNKNCSKNEFIGALETELKSVNSTAKSKTNFDKYDDSYKLIYLAYVEDQILAKLDTVGFEQIDCSEELISVARTAQTLNNIELISPYVNYDYLYNINKNFANKDNDITNAFDVILRHSYGLNHDLSEKALVIYRRLLDDYYADLFDAIYAVKKGRQLYGTRGDCDETAIWHFTPKLEDPRNFKKRLKEIGFDNSLYEGMSCASLINNSPATKQ